MVYALRNENRQKPTKRNYYTPTKMYSSTLEICHWQLTVTHINHITAKLLNTNKKTVLPQSRKLVLSIEITVAGNIPSLVALTQIVHSHQLSK